MNNVFHKILDWSEVWALLIPLTFILYRKKSSPYLKPVKLYVVLALLINIGINLIWINNVHHLYDAPPLLQSNNFLYNIHSIVRLLLLSWFFILLEQRFMHRVKFVLPFLFIIVAAINFIFFENFFNYNVLSSRLLATEAAILLFYCLQYFIFILIEDKAQPFKNQPGIWVVTGLTIYVASSFSIFLFYTYLLKKSLKVFAVNIWDVHNIAYIILCIFIAINFYKKNE